ncbi:hypothetical protein [Pseudofrankia inefficax]|uniref:hypothetical protein n=1 Tax=Pseudofrankia inefficax (strain DSM 45817 / CECT 9037 / DDB 130130 / EuI1c) TaxID=298654 RepID=UPI0012FD5518|nr:hypothetical protein [Pseudofrankia inefficax]
MVERKHWSAPVDSKTLGYFVNTLATHSAELAVVVASNGITGDREKLTNAHALS